MCSFWNVPFTGNDNKDSSDSTVTNDKSGAKLFSCCEHKCFDQSNDSFVFSAPSGAEVQSELVFSESSAFRRIPAVTHKKSLLTEREAEEQESNVSELLVGLDSTISELINSLTSMQQQKDVQLQDSQRTMWVWITVCFGQYWIVKCWNTVNFKLLLFHSLLGILVIHKNF